MRIVKEFPIGPWKERYFPEEKGNKVFAVDVYYTLAKCFKVEAKNEADAERIVNDMMASAFGHATGAEAANIAAEMGFEDCEDYEVSVSGEANENGEIVYY